MITILRSFDMFQSPFPFPMEQANYSIQFHYSVNIYTLFKAISQYGQHLNGFAFYDSRLNSSMVRLQFSTILWVNPYCLRFDMVLCQAYPQCVPLTLPTILWVYLHYFNFIWCKLPFLIYYIVFSLSLLRLGTFDIVYPFRDFQFLYRTFLFLYDRTYLFRVKPFYAIFHFLNIQILVFCTLFIVYFMNFVYGFSPYRLYPQILDF